MPQLKLVIANKNISSWSMRPWVLLTEAGIPFEEELVPFGAPGWQKRVDSPSGRVPLLVSDGLRIWDSLAIAEHVNELFPEKQLWPADPRARAIARAVSSEMHSGFPDLRRECSMNLVLRTERTLSEKAASDVRRVDALFAQCRETYGSAGALLFGRFSIADAMFAPVASRVRSYGLKFSPVSQRYVDALWALPAVQRWASGARAEVDAGIADPVSHGALFSRAEAEQFAKGWVDRLNAKQLDALASLCSERAQTGAQQGRTAIQSLLASSIARTGALELTGCAWDGDVNALALSLRDGQGVRALWLLRFDADGLVAEVELFSS